MAKRLSVLMVSASFYPTIGGAERQALELSKALIARGLSVRVLTRRLRALPRSEEIEGVPVERLWCAGEGSFNALTFMISLLAYFWRHAPFYEVIHVHLAGSPAVAAALAARLLGKGVLVKMGGGMTRRSGGRELGVGELASSSETIPGRLKIAALARLRPRVVAVTRGLMEEAVAHLGALDVDVLPNGVDTRRLRPASPEEKIESRRDLGLPESGLGFLYAGRFAATKRLAWFLELWAAQVQRSKTPAFLALAGEGPEEPLLREIARHLEVSERVFFLGALRRIEPACRACEIFVLPSVSEGLSNALLESMSSGLAVLGSRVAGTAEAVRDAREGFLFDPGDAQALSAQIAKFLAFPHLAEQLGRAGRERAVAEYSLDVVAERYEALYRDFSSHLFP